MWIFAYLLIGYALGIFALVNAQPRPGEQLPWHLKLVVWANIIAPATVFWPLLLLGWVWNCLRGSEESPELPTSDSPQFPRNGAGQLVLARPVGGAIPGIVFFVIIAWSMAAGCWLQERQFSPLMIGAMMFALLVTVLMAMPLRQRRSCSHGLVTDERKLIWTECPGWTPRTFCIPLNNIAYVQSLQTDPVCFERGLLLVLKPESSGQGNLDARYPRETILPGWMRVDSEVPLEQIVLWPADKWDWRPDEVLAWFKNAGVPHRLTETASPTS